jgi:predicted DNA-binding protein
MQRKKTAMETQLTIRLPARLARQLRSAAESCSRSRSDLVRIAIEAWLEQGRDPDEHRPPIERIRDLLGTADSGVTDLGSEHRKHLLARFRGES